MEKALNSILLNDSGINLSVSGRVSIMRRDDLFPAITYEKTSKTQELDAGGRPMGPIKSSFQVTARAKTYREAKEISDLIAARLNGFTGEESNVKILLTLQDGESSSQLTDPDITETTLDYTFYHK